MMQAAHGRAGSGEDSLSVPAVSCTPIEVDERRAARRDIRVGRELSRRRRTTAWRSAGPRAVGQFLRKALEDIGR